MTFTTDRAREITYNGSDIRDRCPALLLCPDDVNNLSDTRSLLCFAVVLGDWRKSIPCPVNILRDGPNLLKRKVHGLETDVNRIGYERHGGQPGMIGVEPTDLTELYTRLIVQRRGKRILEIGIPEF